MSAQTESRPSDSRPHSGLPQEDPSQLPPGQAFKTAWSRLAEIGEFARHYASARSDLFKLKLLNIAILAALGVIGLIAGAALIATLIVLLCSGLAQAVAAGLGGRAWAGNLIVGGGLLLLIGVGAAMGLSMMRRKHFEQTKAKYELRHKNQREQFGQSAFERSQSAAPKSGD